MAEKKLLIAFLTVGPNVKLRFEEYRYLLNHLLCIKIIEDLLSDSHSTGPRNLSVAFDCHYSPDFRPQIYDESETDQILHAKYFV